MTIPSTSPSGRGAPIRFRILAAPPSANPPSLPTFPGACIQLGFDPAATHQRPNRRAYHGIEAPMAEARSALCSRGPQPGEQAC